MDPLKAHSKRLSGRLDPLRPHQQLILFGHEKEIAGRWHSAPDESYSSSRHETRQCAGAYVNRPAHGSWEEHRMKMFKHYAPAIAALVAPSPCRPSCPPLTLADSADGGMVSPRLRRDAHAMTVLAGKIICLSGIFPLGARAARGIMLRAFQPPPGRLAERNAG
jgi:hypothetical protein